MLPLFIFRSLNINSHSLFWCNAFFWFRQLLQRQQIYLWKYLWQYPWQYPWHYLHMTISMTICNCDRLYALMTECPKTKDLVCAFVNSCLHQTLNVWRDTLCIDRHRCFSNRCAIVLVYRHRHSNNICAHATIFHMHPSLHFSTPSSPTLCPLKTPSKCSNFALAMFPWRPPENL